MIAEDSTRSELKAFVLKSCARMPQIGDAVKIPWDGWASIWRVMKLKPDAIILEAYRMRKGDVTVHTLEIKDEKWIECAQSGLIRPPRDDE